MSLQSKWLDAFIVTIPGLSFLVYGLALPKDLRGFVLSSLSVMIFASLGIILLSRARIRRWSLKRTARRATALAAGALLFFFAFFIVQGTLVRSYKWPPKATTERVVVLPVTISASLNVGFPYTSCLESLGRTCDTPINRSARTPDEIMDLLTAHGPWTIRLPGGWPYVTSIASLTFLVVATALQLVLLFGILVIRGITPARLLKAFTGQTETGDVGVPGSKAPQAG
jgi:hypothetical protein